MAMEFGQQRQQQPPRAAITASCEELIPGLPYDVAVECFLRLPYTAHSAACQVSKSWRSLLCSQPFYALRRSRCRTRSLACLVQQSPPYSSWEEHPGAKPAAAMDSSEGLSLVQLTYSISVFDPGSLSWTRVPPIPDFPDGLPLFCQLASTDGKLLVLGGWDPVAYNPLHRVYLHDFVTGEWRRCANMPGARTFFAASGADGGRVFMAGGHDESKNALGTAWSYDVERDAWEEMEGMSQERDECEGLVLRGGTEFWVVSGYRTEKQGQFEGSADVYEVREGGRPRWKRRVEGAWREGKCPRGGVIPGIGSEVVSVSDRVVMEAGACVGLCGALTAGKAEAFFTSEYPCGKQGLYVAECKDDGKIGNFVKVEVPEEFSGFIQSGCCIEV